MKKLSFILLLSMMTFVGIRCDAQMIFLNGKITADTIEVGQHFDYQLSLTIPKDYNVEWKQFDDTLSKSIDVINAGEVKITPINNSDNVIMTQSITMTSFDTGYVYVPEIAITYSKSIQDSIRHTLRTDEKELYVTTIAVDTTQAFRPIKGVMKQGITAKEIFPWLAVIIVIAGIVYLIIYLKKHKTTDEKKEEVKAKPAIPAIITARAKLSEMRENEQWNSSKTKDYYTDLTDIAREYLEGQFAIDAIEMTSSEIMEAVNALNLNEFTKSKLHETLITADLVKFAKANPTAEENEQSFKDIDMFVEDSYIYFQEVEKKKEEESK